jgi:hypothetical protein
MQIDLNQMIEMMVRLMYLVGVGCGIALFLFARRFKTGLRALLQMIGASVAAVALFFLIFIPDQHEYEVLMFDFVGGPLPVVIALAAVIGAVWAVRRNGCLTMALAGMAAIILSVLVALAWIGGVLLNGSPHDATLRIMVPIYLVVLALGLGAWTIFGIVQERKN